MALESPGLLHPDSHVFHEVALDGPEIPGHEGRGTQDHHADGLRLPHG